MQSDRDAIVARARSLVGARFRPQGRSAERGLDCIGVVMLAAGIPCDRVRDDYSLRDGDIDEVNAKLADLGFVPLRPEESEAGDILIANSGASQLHALVLTSDGHVHAHAGLRRVVETPGVVPWAILGAWRAPAIGA